MDIQKFDINIFLKNIDSYYSYKISNKVVIGNSKVNSEFLYIRRLFIDWLNSSKNFYYLKKYQSFKSTFSKYLTSLQDQDKLNNNFVIWKDFQIFLKNHNQFLTDVYRDLYKSYRCYSKTFILLNFSILCVNFFYKWRQKRNDSMRSWFSYDNRRKKAFKINMAYFSNIMLKEAEYSRYRSHLHDGTSYVKVI